MVNFVKLLGEIWVNQRGRGVFRNGIKKLGLEPSD
jgi:hypothetical protein